MALTPLANETPLPTNVSTLTRDDFAGRNYFSVADALEGLLSLNLERDGARGTRALAKIRGGSHPNRTLILLDGRPLTHEFDSQVDLSQIPINIVERIEMTRGGSSLSYSAEAVSGVIHIITSRPKEKNLKADLGTGVGRDGVKHSNGRFFGRSYLGDMTFLSSQEISGGFNDNEQSETNNYFLNFMRSFNGKGFFGAEYYFQESHVGVSSGTPFPISEWNGHLEREPSSRSHQRKQESQHLKFLLASPLVLGGTFYTNYTESFREKEDRATPKLTLRAQENRSSRFDLKWERENFQVGGEKREFKRVFEPDFVSKVHQTGFFILNKWAHDKWFFLPALRYDRHSNAGRFITPRLALLFQAQPTLLFSATANRGFRSPTFEELFFSSASLRRSSVHFEKTESYDIGTAWSPSPRCRFSITGFTSRIKDLIRFDSSSNDYLNKGTERNRGVETSILIKTGENTQFRRFTFTSNWTYQDGRRSLKDGRGFLQSPLTPRHLGFFKVDHHLPLSMTLTNEVRTQSAQFELENRQGLKIPSYYVWNLRFKVKILSADLYADMENVTGRRFADTLALFTPTSGASRTVLSPQPDRTFWTGVSIQFKN